MEPRKDALKPELGIGARMDAIKALEGRFSFTDAVIANIEKTRAQLFLKLPAFQVPMETPKLGEELKHEIKVPQIPMKGEMKLISF